MSKKKKPQQNLSLKERLEKHWNSRKWDAFISLFLRNREASMRTPWVERWPDAVYNCLTNALFVDRNFQSAEMAVDLVRGEGELLSPWLHDCADVASDFLAARKNAFLTAPSPLRDEANLPSPYAPLRGGYASLVATDAKARKSKKNEAAALVDKLAAQYGRLGKAKSLSPWSTWLKIAQQLEEATGEADCAGTFRAVRAIVALTCELLHAKADEDLRDISELPENPLFRSIPNNQNHPAVGMLWDFFCRSGERKYGEEWGAMARVLQLSFMTGQSALKEQYGRLMKEREYDGPSDLLLPLFPGAPSFSATSPASGTSLRWTEQETYILRMFFVIHYEEGKEEVDPEGFLHFLRSFEILGRLGRRWRPQAPWTRPIQRGFEKILFTIPRRMLLGLMSLNLPWEAISAPGLLCFALADRYQAEELKKKVPSRFPLRLSLDETERLFDFLPPRELSRGNLRTIRTLLDDAGYVALFARWVETIVVRSGEDAARGAPSSRQVWGVLGTDLLEELAETLPSDGVEGCLCRLGAGEKSCSLSADPAKVEAFFRALASEMKKYVSSGKVRQDRVSFWTYLFVILLGWPEVSPHFLVRLFDMTFTLHRRAAADEFVYWSRVASRVGDMKNEASQKLVAACVLDKMKQIGKGRAPWDVKDAIRSLKKLAGASDDGKKPRGSKASSSKKKRTDPPKSR
ncbi:MAG: hypothetical protein LBT15_02060 [Synergistaceae bacterium]|jgi:hypothetical protein|nr:hypothetical protein [Synergistaceae bacterium]